MIIEKLDKHLREENIGEKQPDCFRISSLGQCFRKRFWERKGEPKEPLDERTLRVFQVGKIYHSYLQEVLKTDLIGSEIEVRVGDFVGHIDAIIKGDKGNTLLDFKTVNSRKFNFIGGEADRHYIMQLLTYAILAEKKYNITESRLVYISKDDFRMCEKVYKLDDNWRFDIASDMKQLDDYWRNNELPPAIPQAKWECSYCNFKQCPSYKVKQ